MLHSSTDSTSLEQARSPKLNLTVIRVADVQNSVQFYQALGFHFVEEKHGAGPAHFASSNAGWVFEIYPAREGVVVENSVRLGFTVDDLQSVLERMQALNAPVASDLVESEEGKRVTLIDPDQNKVDLWEPPQA